MTRGVSKNPCLLVVCCAVLCLLSFDTAFAGSDIQSPLQTTTVQIPRITDSPKLEDFEGFRPATPLAQSMVKVDQFVTGQPVFGKAPKEPTEVFMGFTEKNLYLVFLAHDSDPKHLRSHMSRREDIDDDDQIGFFLDTFADQRNAYMFYLNPKGIQQDGTISLGENFSLAWDGIWNDVTKVTEQGYMVLVEIPFKSLRFRQSGDNTWRFFFHRAVLRNGEASFFPAFKQGRSYPPWQDMAVLKGMEGVKPGRSLQFIPYFTGRAFQSTDTRDLNHVAFTGRAFEPRVGLDSKAVIKNSIVLDTTVNPDFAQVESDAPQITVNQRFEVFFPEKRPFFIENAGYFQTPINLVFTRRIADPMYGFRATGKIGKWSLGALTANDRAPGKVVTETDPLAARDAQYGVLRVNREFGKDNTIGMIYTDRELDSPLTTACTDQFCAATLNRVGGVDGHLRFDTYTDASFQFVHSRSEYNDGTHLRGHDYYGVIQRRTRNWFTQTSFKDTSPEFETLTGFFERPDVRRWQAVIGHTMYAKGEPLISHGPFLRSDVIWDHNGLRTGYVERAEYHLQMLGETQVIPFGEIDHERLRPSDFSGLTANRDYARHHYGVTWDSRYFRYAVLRGQFSTGRSTNYASPDGVPRLSNSTDLQFTSINRMPKGVSVESTALWSRLADRQTNQTAFNDYILRQKWNLQFNSRMSLRFITQYEATLANPLLANLPQRKNVNFDVLFTYFLHPGTAFYAGYNSNLQNLDRALNYNSNIGDFQRSQKFLNDGRQIFVKLSYQFRY